MQKDILLLNCINIGPDDKAKCIKFKFEIYEDNNLKFKSEERTCTSKFIPQAEILVPVPNINIIDKQSHIFCELKTDISKYQTFLNLPINTDCDNRNRITNLLQRVKTLKIKNRTLVDKVKGTPNFQMETSSTTCGNLCMCKEYDYSKHDPKLYVDPAILEKYPSYKISPCGYGFIRNATHINLFCSNCQELFTPYWPISECASCNHFICNLCCTFANVDHCTNKSPLTQNVAITNLFNNIKINCKWNCGKWFLSSDIVSHQKTCDRRPKQFCPVLNCSWNGKLADMEKHFNIHQHFSIIMSNRIDDSLLNDLKDTVYVYTERDVIAVLKRHKNHVGKFQIVEVLPQLKLGNYNVLLQEFKSGQFSDEEFVLVGNKVFRIIIRDKS